MQKLQRQALIKELIQTQVIENQQQLQACLAAKQIKVSQVTLSRDLQELCISKQHLTNGQSQYVIVEPDTPSKEILALNGIAKAICQQIIWQDQLVLIKTEIGYASTFKRYLRSLQLFGVLACLADDDQVLIVCIEAKIAQQISYKLKALIEHN